MEYIIAGLVSAVALAALVGAVVGVVRTVRRRNRPATPAEQEAYRQRERDAQRTSQDIASRNRTAQTAAECNQVRQERARIIESGSTQPMPEWPRGADGEFIC